MTWIGRMGGLSQSAAAASSGAAKEMAVKIERLIAVRDAAKGRIAVVQQSHFERAESALGGPSSLPWLLLINLLAPSLLPLSRWEG